MPVACEPLPKQLAEEMLQVAARALCDRPGDNPAQRDSRTRQMVHSVLGMQPRDGIELMLCTMVVGHYETIMDAMREGLQSPVNPSTSKVRSSTIALVRSMTSLMRELRIERERPVMRWPAESAAATDTAMATTIQPSTRHGPPSAPIATPGSAAVFADPSPPIQAGPRGPGPGDGAIPLAVRPMGQAGVELPRESQPEPATATMPRLPLAAALEDLEPDEGTILDHIRMYDDALASMNETLEEMRVFGQEKLAGMTGNRSKVAV